MTAIQKKLLDSKTPDELRIAISVIAISKCEDKDALIEYCRLKLSRLDRSSAVVELSEGVDFE